MHPFNTTINEGTPWEDDCGCCVCKSIRNANIEGEWRQSPLNGLWYLVFKNDHECDLIHQLFDAWGFNCRISCFGQFDNAIIFERDY